MFRRQLSLAKFLLILSFGLTTFLMSSTSTIATNQTPSLRNLFPYPSSLLGSSPNNQIVTACIRLDGRCAFNITFPKNKIANRVNEIQSRLNNLKANYLQNPDRELNVTSLIEGENADIRVVFGSDSSNLLTITQQDASSQGMSLQAKANLVAEKLEAKLLQAKQQRTQEYLLRQGIASLIILIAIAIIFFGVRRSRIKTASNQGQFPRAFANPSISFLKNLRQKENWHLQEAKYRLLQVFEYSIVPAGLLLILGLFPQTRALQLALITAIRFPLRIILVGILTYLLIRLFYSLIDRLSSTISGSRFVLSPRANKRLQLRVTTISQVIKGILTVVLIITGFLIGLWSVGVNITPFLAGAGIIGLALSFASQSIIKDALNGFLIIFEDQYAVGDVINLNNVAGKVENINLRITKIRDAEGRLITIPNSEVKIVANLSSQWSQADLKIPIAYSSDLNQAIETIRLVASQMSQEEPWQNFILEQPLILGVEEFSDRGIIVRLFIKTEPLKQWDVSREFRLRLQIALDNVGIPIVAPEQIFNFKEKNKLKD